VHEALCNAISVLEEPISFDLLSVDRVDGIQSKSTLEQHSSINIGFQVQSSSLLPPSSLTKMNFNLLKNKQNDAF